MPNNASMKLRLPYIPSPRAQEERRSAAVMAHLAVSAVGLSDRHRKDLLNVAVWKCTEADGKLKCRYRSAGVLSDVPSDIHHEHVITRKASVACILEHRDLSTWLLGAALACLVTVEEHAQLSLQKEVSGWKRYEKAGVVVYDMKPRPKVEYRPWDEEPGLSVTGVESEYGSVTPAEFIEVWFRNQNA